MLKKKKREPLPKDFWVCKGCNRKTNVYWNTTLGNRCLRCVINYDLTFYWEKDNGFKQLAKARWMMNDEEISKFISLK
jgi:hypothetical protein